jgi:protease-4
MKTTIVAAAFLACTALALAGSTTRPSASVPSTQLASTQNASLHTSLRAAASTQSTTTSPTASTQTTAFPTPAELIDKMRAMKKTKDALPHVAYIDLTRPIVEKPADFSLFGDPDSTTLRNVLERLRQAKGDKEIRAVLITLSADSALSLAQAQEIRDALSEINRAGKKTFVYADAYDTAAYTLASSATHICMLEGGEIMIPGIGMEAMFAKGLLDKVGVQADYIQIGEYKGADEEYTRTAPSAQMKGEMTKLADSLYQQIIDGISLNRNLSKEDVTGIVDDAMLSAEAAKNRGLVDDLTDIDNVRNLIAKELSTKKIDLIHDYGKPQHEELDMSNPWSLFAAMSRRPEPTGKPQIALVYLDGVITDGEGGQSLFGGNSAGSEQLRKSLRMAARDENVKAVVIRIDSPGGSALASEVIWQAARRVAEKKPLIISVGGMAASGGYYVASAGQHIFADPAAIVGSIGVVGGKFVTKDLFDKLGVATESFSKGANANLFSSSQPWDPRQRKMVTQWMKQTYDQFTERVMSTRGNEIKHIDDVARGRIFAAKQAKDIGLVDEIGGMQTAIAYAATEAALTEGNYDVRTFPAPRTLADYFGGGNLDALSPIQPKISLAGEALSQTLSEPARRFLSLQVQALQLLQHRPVMLVSPYVISYR